ncbi:MAG: winged helix-turn-helix domain-containing protein [archaeon]|nr:winged helix-turn-helix domain-containing protein [Candidatus Micrarchaeota archaeon]
MDLFRVLGNENRRKILKLLFEREMHLNEIARKIGVSVPVVFKHVKVLEKNGLVERRRVGSTHLLKIKEAYLETIRKLFTAVEKAYVIRANKGETLLSAFRETPGIEIRKEPNGYLIESIDGKKGYFLFEINGRIPRKSMEKIVLKEDSEISFYRLTPVLGKRFVINIEK